MKKYEFTDETKEVNGVVLHRIKAVRDFGSVKAGSLGGFIKKNSNLSHGGDAWVFGNAQVSGDAWVSGDAQVSGNARVFGNAQVSGDAQVSGNARVFGDAQVSGNARVFGDAQVSGNAQVSGDAWVSGDAQVSGNAQVEKINDILTVGPVGSRNDVTTFYKNKDGGISVICGCFCNNIDKFFERVQEVHGDSKHGKTYKKCIEIAKMQIIADE